MEKSQSRQRSQQSQPDEASHMATNRQIAALKFLIIKSKYSTTLLEQILFFLIMHSSRLTRSVCVTVFEQVGITGNDLLDAAHGLSRMNHLLEDTHLNELMVLAGSKLRFHFHVGDRSCQLPNGKPYSYTFWLSSKPCSSTAQQVKVTKNKLNRIRLRSSELFTAPGT